MSTKDSLSRYAIVLTCLILIPLVTVTVDSENAAKEAMNTALERVLPVLIPCFVLSNIIGATLPEGNGRLSIFTVYSVGATCGNPIGAVLTEKLYQRGCISKKEASLLLPFCSHTSPAFCICIIGKAVLGSSFLGGIMWLFSAITGLIATIVLSKKAKTTASPPKEEIPDIRNAINTAIKNAASASCSVTVLMVFFTSLGSCLGTAFNMSEEVYAFFMGFLELGSATLVASELPIHLRIAACAFSAAFCGLSVFFQICACAPSIPKYPYLVIKCLVAGVALILASVFAPNFDIAIENHVF